MSHVKTTRLYCCFVEMYSCASRFLWLHKLMLLPSLLIYLPIILPFTNSLSLSSYFLSLSLPPDISQIWYLPIIRPFIHLRKLFPFPILIHREHIHFHFHQYHFHFHHIRSHFHGLQPVCLTVSLFYQFRRGQKTFENKPSHICKNNDKNYSFINFLFKEW